MKNDRNNAEKCKPAFIIDSEVIAKEPYPWIINGQPRYTCQYIEDSKIRQAYSEKCKKYYRDELPKKMDARSDALHKLIIDCNWKLKLRKKQIIWLGLLFIANLSILYLRILFSVGFDYYDYSILPLQIIPLYYLIKHTIDYISLKKDVIGADRAIEEIRILLRVEE